MLITADLSVLTTGAFFINNLLWIPFGKILPKELVVRFDSYVSVFIPSGLEIE